MLTNRHNRRKAVRERAQAAILRQPPLSRLLFIFLAVVALAIQIFVVQAHIHIPQAAGHPASVSIITVAQNLIAGPAAGAADQQANLPRDKYPINEDPSNCPLCQEIAHSGQFLHSVAALAALPAFVNVHVVIFSEALPSFFVVSHSWRGRAPPRI